MAVQFKPCVVKYCVATESFNFVNTQRRGRTSASFFKTWKGLPAAIQHKRTVEFQSYKIGSARNPFSLLSSANS